LRIQSIGAIDHGAYQFGYIPFSSPACFSFLFFTSLAFRDEVLELITLVEMNWLIRRDSYKVYERRSATWFVVRRVRDIEG
jgi:hypothetical protein